MEYHSYIIAYDLCKPGRDYNSLYNSLRSFRIWGKLTESVWCVVTEWDSVKIRDFLTSCLDVNDRLIVIKSGGEAAWKNMKASNDWIKQNIVK